MSVFNVTFAWFGYKATEAKPWVEELKADNSGLYGKMHVLFIVKLKIHVLFALRLFPSLTLYILSPMCAHGTVLINFLN